MDDKLVSRLEQSVQFLIDGIAFTVGEFVIGKSENGRIFVNGYTNFMFLENIDREAIEKELFDLKMEFLKLMGNSQKFREFVKNIGIDYYLLFDTGQTGIQICGEEDGVYKVFI